MKNAGLTTEAVEAKLRKLHGNAAAVARHFGVTRQRIWSYIQERPTLKAAYADIREGMKDEAEDALRNAVGKGEGWAVCFYLKCQAKDRGYVERTEYSDVSDDDLDSDIDAEMERLAAREKGGAAGPPPPAPPPPAPVDALPGQSAGGGA